MTNDMPVHMQITEEDGGVRIRAGKLNFLLPNVGQAQFLQDYRRAERELPLDLSATHLENGEKVELDPLEGGELRLHVILSWLKFCYYNRLPAGKFDDALHAGTTFRVIRQRAEKKYGKRSTKSIALGAHAVRVSTTEYLRWLDLDDVLRSMN